AEEMISAEAQPSVAALSGPLFAEMNGGPAHERRGNRHPTFAPHGAFKVKETPDDPDRWLVLACTNETQWQALAAACGRPEWGSDPRFANREARKANEDELERLLIAWAAQRDGRETMERLQAAGVPAGLVLSASDVLADRHLKERGYFIYLEQTEAGLRAYDGSGFHLSRTPLEPSRAAPLLGEHTFEIASEVLGLSEDDIADLVADGVLR
ncbi:MAG: CoA transferase, partial [Dehalococcoidia bacterium]